MTENRNDLESLWQRLQVVEDEAAVRNVIVRYGLAVDCGNAQAAMALHTEDCVYEVSAPGSGREDADQHDEALLLMEGREAIGNMVNGAGHRALLPNCAHTVGPLEVAVRGDVATATGYSRLYLAQVESVDLLRLGFNRWQLRRTDGQWRIAHRASRTIGSETAQKLLHEASAEWQLTP